MTLAQEFERRGLEKGVQQGMQQGMQQGEAALLIRQFRHRFGETAAKQHEQRIIGADAQTLLRWGERVLDSVTLEDVFKDG